MAVLVTLVNRTSKTLQGTWDGKHYDLEPEKRYQFPEIQAQKFKDQNPLMGSEDQYTGDVTSLLAIEEHGDESTPLEQTNALTRKNLFDKIASGELRVVQGNGLYTFADRVAGLPPDGAGFVKP